ncbi:MAG: acyltransferase [Actinobacteria bacterium]|nr:acyltransferase [Actinomycetota bacterium]
MTAEDRGQRIPHAPGLDGIRGLAVVAVLVYHAGPATWLPGGFLGVSLFFTLSGYLIGSLVVAEVERTGGIDLGRFWARRARRLLPALLVALAGSAVLARIIELSDRTQRELIAGLTYTSNWIEIIDGRTYGELFGAPSPASHLWSLAVEEQFYLVFPLAVLGLVRLVGDRRFRTWLIVGSGVVYVGGIAVATAISTSAAYYSTPARAPEIATGVALAAWTRHPERPAGRLLGLVGLAALATVALACVRTQLTTPWVGNGGLAVFGLVSAVLIAAAGRPGPLGRVLSPPPLTFLGRISYGLYLYHWPVVIVLDRPRVHMEPVPLFLLRSAVSIGVATASYHLVEQPIRHGRWGGSRRPAVVLARSGAAIVATAVFVVLAVPPATPTPEAADAPAVIDPGEQTTGSTTADGSEAAGPTTVVILGDSVPNWMVRDGASALDPTEVALIDGTSEGCDGAEGSPTGRANGGVVVTLPEDCTGWHDQYPPVVEAGPVDVALLVIGSGAVLDRKLGDDFYGPCDATARDWYLADVTARLEYLSEHADKVVLALPAWAEEWSGWVNPPDHHERTDCVRATLNDAVARAREAGATNIEVIDLGAHLCPDGPDDCEPVRERDGVHIDPSAAPEVLTWLIAEAIG